MRDSRHLVLLTVLAAAACSSAQPVAPDLFWQPSSDRGGGRADTWVMRPDANVEPPADSAPAGPPEWRVVTVDTSATLHAVWGTSAEDVWAVGDGGVALHYDGVAWEVMQADVSEGLRAVWGSSPGDVWAAGVDGALTHWDGGKWTAWSAKPSTSEWINGLWGAAEDDVWAVGGAGVIWHFTGSAWSAVANPEKRSISDVIGFAKDDVWGASAGIFRYNGSSWSYDDANPTTTLLSGIWGSGPKDVWIVGHFMEIAHYDGQRWELSSQQNDQGPHLYAIWGSGADDVWTVGQNGKIMRFEGQSWSDWPSPTQQSLIGLWGSGAEDIWAVGSGGTVLRYH